MGPKMFKMAGQTDEIKKNTNFKKKTVQQF